jgi:hypothetical protein
MSVPDLVGIDPLLTQFNLARNFSGGEMSEAETRSFRTGFATKRALKKVPGV